MLFAPLFRGENIRLTAFRPDDYAVFARWFDDTAFGRLFDARAAYPISEGRVRGWFTDADQGRSIYAFAMRPLDTDELIGYIELEDIQWTHRTAWLSLAIGDPAHQGRGYGGEAIQMMLRFAFRELNLRRVTLSVFSYNEAAIRLYERIGFVREGVQREAILREGEAYDMLIYGMLAREWEAR